MARRSPRGKPSSRISEKLRYFGSPPAMHRSLTVPQTASLPMSPPGKHQGVTTKLSVEKTGGPSSAGSTAPSPSWLRAVLAKAGTRIWSISWAVLRPPLP